MTLIEQAEDQRRGLLALIEQQKRMSFTDPAAASDEKALGKLLAMFCTWDGDALLRVLIHALTDANFEATAARVLALKDEGVR
jgi:hypothetical protein